MRSARCCSTPCASRRMLPDWLPWLLQINDSQFPSGAYAHSMGLEELVQRGVVRGVLSLEVFLHRQIIPSLLAFELPFLVRAHTAAVAGDDHALRLLDHELNAWKLAEELRTASRQLGTRRLALVRKLSPSPLLERYVEGGTPCHHLVVCALELRSAPAEAAVCAFAYQTLSGAAYACMKLMRLGQESAQALVRGSLTILMGQFNISCGAPGNRIGWFNPLLEIASMRHARAAERLFIS